MHKVGHHKSGGDFRNGNVFVSFFFTFFTREGLRNAVECLLRC
jgi:hypothetical protein